MKLPSLQSILIGMEYNGIEHYTVDGEEWCAFLEVKKRENELQIAYNDKQVFSDLPKRIDRKSPTCLVINTNQILHKELSESNLSDDKIVHRAFPNLSMEAFFYQIWQKGDKTIIAVARKQYVNDIIEKYTTQGFAISSISLGICSLSGITDFLSADTIYTNFQKVAFEEEPMLLSNEKITQTLHYKINGLTVQNSYLLAFSEVLQFLLKGNQTKGNIIAQRETLRDIFLQQTFFKKGLQTVLGVLLALLLVNFLVFNHYYSKALEITELSTLNTSSSETLAIVKKRIIEKEKLANSLFNISADSYSAKINAITKSIPNSILLTELKLNPLEKNIKEDEKIAVQQNVIIVTGTTKENNAFTKWVEELGKMQSIKDIVISQFGKNDQMETTFTLKLNLK